MSFLGRVMFLHKNNCSLPPQNKQTDVVSRTRPGFVPRMSDDFPDQSRALVKKYDLQCSSIKNADGSQANANTQRINLIHKPNMSNVQITSRQAYRRTDDFTPGTPKVKLITEPLPHPLPATSVLIKVHAVSLNYRDANIANGGNPWPVTPHGILGNDAAGEVVSIGDQVKTLALGDRVAPITDTENITGREPGRSWLAADEDGVLADYLVFDEGKLCKLPDHLDWVEASIIPCAGVTAWASLKDVGFGKSVLIQGTSTTVCGWALADGFEALAASACSRSSSLGRRASR